MVLRLQQVSLIRQVLDEGGFFLPLCFLRLFLSQLGRGVFLCCIFLSRYFSVSFQYNFFSFTYKKKLCGCLVMKCFSLQETSITSLDRDRVLWIETKCGKFSVKFVYKALESGPSISFPSNVIWKSCVQPKVSFFGWEATWWKALTLDQLQKKG